MRCAAVERSLLDVARPSFVSSDCCQELERLTESLILRECATFGEHQSGSIFANRLAGGSQDRHDTRRLAWGEGRADGLTKSYGRTQNP